MTTAAAATAVTTNEPRLAAAPGEESALPVKFEALAPVASPANLKSLLERSSAVLHAVLPRHVTPERLWRTLLVAANRNPDILKCTQASVIECITRAGELGLDLSGTMGEAYAVPFNNKVTRTLANGAKEDVWVMQLQMIPGYRGLAKLARQSGEVARIEAEEVRKNDRFVYRKGSDFRVEFEPCLTGDRGEVVGFYAYARLADGSEQADYMTVADVEKVRQKAKSKNSPAWQDWFSEMGRKTVFRRLSKWLPLSSEKFQTAIQQDNLDVNVESLIPTIDTTPTARTEALVDRLEASGGNGDAAAPAAVEAAGSADPQPSTREREPGEDAELTTTGGLFSEDSAKGQASTRRR